MSASEVPRRVTPEWGILKSLRRHRTRLWNETKYRRFSTARTSVSETERQNNLDLLESGLRNIMSRNDLDTLLDGGLDEPTMGHAQIHLESLCNFMEQNVSATDSSYPQCKLPGTTSKYYRLEALLNELANTNWAFVMVSGTVRKLFQSFSPGAENKDIESFNEFFSNLTQPSVADIYFPTKTLPFDSAGPGPGTGHPQDQLAATFDGLDVLLSQFNDSLNCKGHHVLLQLPELNITASDERFRASRLELFLSTCRLPSLWLEGQLDTLSPADNTDLYPISGQLCDHIHATREIGDRLYLTVSNKEICIRDNSHYSDGEDNYSKLHAGKQPSKTLKELLEKGAFNSSIFGYRGTRFTENEKQDLAATLISNLALSLVSSRIKCWDSDAIYFLAEPNGECIRSCPYALCMFHSKQDFDKKCPNETQKLGLTLEDADFERLAKLLLEIRGWSLPSDIALLATIESEMYNNLGNQPYLRAVHDCLKFRNLYQRHVDLKASRGQTVDAVAAVKHIISAILKGIRLPMQQILRRKRQLDDGDQPEYAISSDHGQLGMSAEPRVQRSQSPYEPNHPHISNSQQTYRNSQAPTKRVRFEYRNEERLGPTLGLPPEANMLQSHPDPQTRDYSPKLAPNMQIHTTTRPGSPGPLRGLSTTLDQLRNPENTIGRSLPNLLGGRPPPPADNRDFEIAIICALTLEADAVEGLFDLHWDNYGYIYRKAPRDPNAYSTGVIGCHNVVLAYMPTMGKSSAASVAANCLSSFTGIKLGLVVGICGAVPFKKGHEILLGDVVISRGIIQYDLGREYSDEFVRKDSLLDNLGRHNSEIQALLAKLQGRRGKTGLQDKTSKYLSALRAELGEETFYPGAAEDKLFESNYRHKHQVSSGCAICAACKQAGDPVCKTAKTSSCAELGCDKTKLVSRNRLKEVLEDTAASGKASSNKPAIHFGLIASGDRVMKCGELRDSIAAKEDIIAFEMEGAGVWDNFPCLVIKGVCDYADSHKNKDWQNYAAAAAAACMKAFLEYWDPNRESVSL
ncbi:hypothetical protein TWF481_010609 [Arthrobotrys musiformis]|uniref:Nucleoside phosphorylase domain-containing protein n=1 Tax=Arthrobotrys musiformis TaxID=47236 RepID=A0AAV9W199_9PEZI